MTPEERAAVTEFMKNFGNFRYPQTVVCDTVNASLSDLNDWRKREFIPPDGYEKRGRIHYTGEMLLRAGFLAELARITGPTYANEVADDFLNVIPFDLKQFEGKVVVIDPNMPRWIKDPKPEWAHIKMIDLRSETETFATLEHAKIILPLGHLLPIWMIGAEVRLAHSN